MRKLNGRQGEYQREHQGWEYWMLFAIVLGGIAVRYYLVTYNLPVASNLDERAMLRIFYKFDHENTLNPEFFPYPTLYFYIKYFLLRPFVGVEHFLYFGRLLNLMLSGVLTLSTFWLSKQVYQSTIPSLLAAAMTMFSPTIIYNASYVITDIQLALFCILSLLFLSRFFETKAYRPWLLGVLLMGLAFATKYSAASLLVAYFILEILHANSNINTERPENRIVKILNTRIAARYISLFLCIAALIGLGFYLFYPYDFLYSMVQKAGNLDSVFDQDDKLFVGSFRNKFLILGIFSAGLAGSSVLFKDLAQRFGLLRPYIGMVSAGVLLLLTSPFILVSWKKFIYDFGAVIKHSSEGESSQWIPYIERYCHAESALIFGFLFVGLWQSWRCKNQVVPLVVYLLVSYVFIGSANQGYVRYLTPMLPVMFVIAAWGIYATGSWLAEKFGRRFLQNFLVLAVTGAIAVELSPKVYAQVFLPRNDSYFAYTYVVQHKPSKVYYSVSAPDVELRLAGFEVEKVAFPSLVHNHLELLNQMKPTDMLILDGEFMPQVNPQLKQQLKLVWQSTPTVDNGQLPHYTQTNQFIFTKR